MSNDNRFNVNQQVGTVSGGKVVGVEIGTVQGDMVQGDKNVIGNVGAGAAVAQGRGATANVTNTTINITIWNAWRNQMMTWIDARANLSAEDKQDAKEQVEKITAEATKGQQADPQRLERFINRLAEYGPDIFEVAVTTLSNPLAGIGLVLKKVADRAKLERTAAAAR